MRRLALIGNLRFVYLIHVIFILLFGLCLLFSEWLFFQYVENAPKPAAPGPGEVLIRVKASSLNAADYKMAAWGSPAWAFPHIPGMDVVIAKFSLIPDNTSLELLKKLVLVLRLFNEEMKFLAVFLSPGKVLLLNS